MSREDMYFRMEQRARWGGDIPPRSGIIGRRDRFGGSDHHSPEDIAAREAIERANGGPVFGGQVTEPRREALMRVIGMLSVGDGDAKAAEVAASVSIRQAAGETPGAFVKRVALALLNEMAGV